MYVLYKYIHELRVEVFFRRLGQEISNGLVSLVDQYFSYVSLHILTEKLVLGND